MCRGLQRDKTAAWRQTGEAGPWSGALEAALFPLYGAEAVGARWANPSTTKRNKDQSGGSGKTVRATDVSPRANGTL